MASELHVDSIKHSGGTSAMTINSSGNVHISGHVIQTQTSTTFTQIATNSTSYVTTGHSVSITPKFSTSRLIFFNSSNCFFYSGSGGSYNTTNFHLQKAVSGGSTGYVNANDWFYQVNAGESNQNKNVSFTYTEIAGTTSAITYTLFLKSTGNDDTVWNEGAYSLAVFTVQEVSV